jgi:hypothetical protein
MMTEIKCMLCDEPAIWTRYTQFAGDHTFCENHAKLEADWHEDDSYLYWEKTSDEQA